MKETIKNQLEMINQQIKILTSIYRGAASKYGISDNEFWVWYALLNLEGECSQQDICDMWSLPKQTVNSIVSNLSKKGYVYLKAIPGTRNKKVITLSEEGKIFGEKIVSQIYCAEQQAFARMTESERETCILLFQKYIDFLKGAMDEYDNQ